MARICWAVAQAHFVEVLPAHVWLSCDPPLIT